MAADPARAAEHAWQAPLEAAFLDHSVQHADASHDMGHLRRVWRNCRAIAAVEAEAVDHEILIAASYLHDWVNLAKNDPDRHLASRRSAEAAIGVLRELGFPPAKHQAVAHAIEAHSFSAGVPPATLEARILQDADRLEALGAIGIARTFYVAGRLNSALFDDTDPFAARRALDDRRFALDHLALKLFKIADTMTTKGGKMIAAARVATMRQFCESLGDELRYDERGITTERDSG